MKIFTNITIGINILTAILCFLSSNPLLIIVGIIYVYFSIFVATDCLRNKKRLGVILHNFVRWPIMMINAPFGLIALAFKEFIDFTNGLSYKYGEFLIKKLKI